MNLLDKKREEHLCRALQRVGSVLVCISLLLALAFPPQPAKAIAVADDVAIAAIVAVFLASCGMTLHATGMNNQEIAQQVYSLTDEWVKANYGSPEEQQQVYEDLKDVGFKDGLILIGGTAAGALSNLAEWVKEKFQVEANSNLVVGGGKTIEDAHGNVYYLWNLSSDFTGMTNEGTVGTIIFANGFDPCDIEFNDGGHICFSYQDGKIHLDSSARQSTFPESKDFNLGCTFGLYLYGGNQICSVFTYPAGYRYKFGSIGKVTYLDSCSYQEESLSIDSSETISIPTTIPDTQQLAISTGAASDLTLDQALEQILAAIAAGELSATKELAEAGTATGEATVPVDEAFPDVGELGLPALGNTLTTRFPFSIPWDVAKAVKLLAAPAKTPRFEVDFFAPISDYVGGWQGSTKVVIDFSEVELLGQLTRWTSTIGFCLMLAGGTKKLIWTA